MRAVAQDFYQTLMSPALAQYERIAIVAHSTGGLAVQAALIDHDDLAKRIACVFFFALPSRGVLPSLNAAFLVPFLGQLLRGAVEKSELQYGSPLLASLSDSWEKKFGARAPFVYYSIAGARDRIVMIGALTSLGAEHRLIVDEDHVSVIHPTSERRESLEIVISALNDQSVPTPPQRRADVVVELAAKEKDDRYDVFMYYGRADSGPVRDIAQRLLGIGKKPWLIEEQGVGQNWWLRLINDVDRINSVAIFFGASSGADWKKQQLSYVIAEFAKREKPILPVFLPNAPPDDSDLPEMLQKIVPVSWSDLSSEAFGQLVAGIEGKRIAMRKQMTASKEPRRRRFIWVAVGSSALIILTVIVLANRGVISLDRSPFDITADYIGTAPHKRPVAVVFVHGIIGSRDATWKNQSASFPALLENDPEFQNEIDVFVYEYYTPKFGNANSIVGLADQFRGSLDDHRVFDDHQRVVFVSHSMGGLVVRQFLITNRERLAKVAMLYFYATPTNGSELTVVAKEISGNPQLRGMLPLEGNELLQSIQSSWLGWDAAKRLPSYCAYETLPTFGVAVVSMASATALCNEPLDPITADHIDIVKPKDRGDPRYTRLAHALRDELTPLDGPTSERATEKQPLAKKNTDRLKFEITSRIDGAIAKLDYLSTLTWTDGDSNTGSTYSLRFAGQYLGSVVYALDHSEGGVAEFKDESYGVLLLDLRNQSEPSEAARIEKASQTYKSIRQFCQGLPTYEEADRKMTREQIGKSISMLRAQVSTLLR